MADYTGSACIVCKETFLKTDDVVVCPECGTPYHRACYVSAGKCINEELHKTGSSWKKEPATAADEPNGVDIRRCPRCGKNNPPLALFCDGCGMPLSGEQPADADGVSPTTQPNADDPYNDYGNPFNQAQLKVNFSDPLCGLNPEEDFDGVKLSELASYVGKNTFYFLPIFKRMKDSGRKLTWNFPAMLAAPMYFAYRKMFLFMVITMVISTLSNLPTLVTVFQSAGMPGIMQSIDVYSKSFNILSTICYFVSWGLMFFSGAFSNWLYYNHCVNAIKRLKKSNPDISNDAAVFKKKGGVSMVALVILLLLPTISAIISSLFMLFQQ